MPPAAKPSAPPRASAPPPAPAVLAALQRAGVACSSCSDPPSSSSEDGVSHDADPALLRAWAKQSVDMESSMLGSTTPFGTHILVSSGKRDWTHDASAEESDAGAVLRALQSLPLPPAAPSSSEPTQEQTHIEGVWKASQHARRVLTASSALSLEEEAGQTSAMLFPHWTAISPLRPDSLADAAPWLDGEAASLGGKETKTRRMVLPYTAVVLLCSHKKRDVRCHISASLLSTSLQSVAEAAGWEVDVRGDLPLPSPSFSDDSQPPTRAADGAFEGRGWGYIHEAAPARPQIEAWRRRAAAAKGETGKEETKRLGMFYCSHIGGHRYAANLICYFPNGAGVWYGRLDPARDAARVFEQTIQNGQIIPEFLRAGVNLVRARGDGDAEGRDAQGAETRTVSGTAAELASLASLRLDGNGEGCEKKKEMEGCGILRW